MRPLTAMVVVAAVALPWYVWVGVRTDGEWLRQVLPRFNLRPFKQPILSSRRRQLVRTARWPYSLRSLYYFYHIPAILVGFFPWSVFLGPTLVCSSTASGEEGDRSNLRSTLRAVPANWT